MQNILTCLFSAGRLVNLDHPHFGSTILNIYKCVHKGHMQQYP